MRSFNFIKFLGVFVFALAMPTACRYCQKTQSENPASTPFVAEELRSEIPFSTKEPEIFQVEIVVTANEAENKMFMARNGANRRYEYNLGAKTGVAFLETDKNYLMFPGEKIFAENAAKDNAPPEAWTDFLTNRWLNAKTDVRFFNEGTENNLTKYRVTFGDAENVKSESFVFVDETINLPVRQEFYSLSGEEKTLTMTIEFRNFKLEAEAGLFTVPKDFRKVSIEEFKSILKKENE
jgi:hypothetical protein